MSRTAWDEQAMQVKAQTIRLRRKIRRVYWLGALGGFGFALGLGFWADVQYVGLAVYACLGVVSCLMIASAPANRYRLAIRRLEVQEDERQRNYLFWQFARRRSSA